MNNVHITQINLNWKEWKHKKVSIHHYKTLVREDFKGITKDGNEFLYLKLPEDTSDLLNAFQTIKYFRSQRTGGLITDASSLIAFKARNRLKDDFCDLSVSAKKFPEAHAVFLKYAVSLAKIYQNEFPETYKKHLNALVNPDKTVLEEYIIPDTPFTSGIANKNNPLAYHRDRGNIPNMLSAMIVLKSNVMGGYLSIPETGLGFEMTNNSIFLFDGQKFVHGVTPMRFTNSNGYRYSMVFYSLAEMWECLPLNEELDRINFQTDKKLLANA